LLLLLMVNQQQSNDDATVLKEKAGTSRFLRVNAGQGQDPTSPMPRQAVQTSTSPMVHRPRPRSAGYWQTKRSRGWARKNQKGEVLREETSKGRSRQNLTSKGRTLKHRNAPQLINGLHVVRPSTPYAVPKTLLAVLLHHQPYPAETC